MSKSQEGWIQSATEQFAEFCRTIAALRDPDSGCPWDLKQNHKTLVRFMIEESYEAAQAMMEGADEDIIDELGDVLLQVVLNAQVAKDRGAFMIADVVRSINEKMIRRHPHVFEVGQSVETAEEVKVNWAKIKEGEGRKKRGVFEEAAAKASFPAMTQAQAIGKRASEINFDWTSADQVLEQLKSEVAELEEAMRGKDSNAIADEAGDVVFSFAQLCRHLKLDAETVGVAGNQKFLKRFAGVEKLARERQIEIAGASQEQLEELWKEVKKSH